MKQDFAAVAVYIACDQLPDGSFLADSLEGVFKEADIRVLAAKSGGRLSQVQLKQEAVSGTDNNPEACLAGRNGSNTALSGRYCSFR